MRCDGLMSVKWNERIYPEEKERLWIGTCVALRMLIGNMLAIDDDDQQIPLALSALEIWSSV
jgi:hypothetical protein